MCPLLFLWDLGWGGGGGGSQHDKKKIEIIIFQAMKQQCL